MTYLKTNICLLIKPDNKIEQLRIGFDMDIEQSILNLKSDNQMNLDIIYQNMNKQFGCTSFRKNIAKGLFPDDSFYYIFCESISKESCKPFNFAGTVFYNTIYNINYSNNEISCYGNCYILLLDRFNETHDCNSIVFHGQIGIVWTQYGARERCEYPVRGLDSKSVVKSVANNEDNGCIIL